MPIYEYFCSQCSTRREVYRPIADRDMISLCRKGHAEVRVYSVPSLSIWNASRPFPNAVKSGDGTFPTRGAYEAHLKANDIAEARIDGKIYRPHGNRVIRHAVRQAER